MMSNGNDRGLPSNNNGTKVSPVLLVLKVIWFILFLSGFEYLFVGYIILEKPTLTGIGLSTPIDSQDLVFLLIALAAIVAGKYLPEVLIDRALERGFDSTDPKRVNALMFQSLIIRWAVYEVPATLGLTSLVLHHDFARIIPFLFASWVCLLVSMPTDRVVENVLKLIKKPRR